MHSASNLTILLFLGTNVAKKAKNALLVNWKPVFTIMDGVLSRENEEDIIKWSPSEVEESFVVGLEILRGQASYAFGEPWHERWGGWDMVKVCPAL